MVAKGELKDERVYSATAWQYQGNRPVGFGGGIVAQAALRPSLLPHARVGEDTFEKTPALRILPGCVVRQPEGECFA